VSGSTVEERLHRYKSSKRLYMLMECVQGGELYSRIHANQSALDPNAVVFYAANVVVALRHLHSKDIVYRDLKVRCLEGWGRPFVVLIVHHSAENHKI
jgi:serine/threonine protein kinase